VDPGAVASSVDATATAASANPTDTAAVAAKRDGATTSGSFGGCVQVNAGIDINAGAEGDFFSGTLIFLDPTSAHVSTVVGLLKDVAQVSLFKKKFQLFKASSFLCHTSTKLTDGCRNALAMGLPLLYRPDVRCAVCRSIVGVCSRAPPPVHRPRSPLPRVQCHHRSKSFSTRCLLPHF
jgi:hypothetical protein